MLKIVVALQELERQWANTKSHPILPPGYDTLSPGIIVGGPGGGADGRLNLFSNAGTAPNYCSVEYNMWFYPDESLEDVQAEVEEVVAAVARTDPWLREHPPRFTWKLGSIYFPPLDVPLDHPAVGTLAECLREVGLDSTPAGLRRRDRPRLVRRAEAAGDHLRARAASRSATSPTSTSRPSSSRSLRRSTRRCSSSGAGSGASVRALVYTLERTLDLLDVDTPVPGAGEVVIRVERVGICGSDVHGVATRSPRRAPPLIMGHELIGEVTAAPEAEALVGRRVAVNPQVPCRVVPRLPLGGREHLPAPRARRREPPRRVRRARRSAGDAAST